MSLDFGKIFGIVLSGAAGGIVTVFTLGMLYPMAHPPIPAQAQIVRPHPVSHVDGKIRTLRVGRSSDLSFHIVAGINKKAIPMLVDTGANITVLTRHDADLAGIPSGDTGRRVDVTGINRLVSHYREVGEWPINLGPIGLVSVPIAVDDSGQLQSSILGQNAFCNIDMITIQNNALQFTHGSTIAEGCATS